MTNSLNCSITQDEISELLDRAISSTPLLFCNGGPSWEATLIMDNSSTKILISREQPGTVSYPSSAGPSIFIGMDVADVDYEGVESDKEREEAEAMNYEVFVDRNFAHWSRKLHDAVQGVGNTYA
jgi:hypothetical protein